MTGLLLRGPALFCHCEESRLRRDDACLPAGRKHIKLKAIDAQNSLEGMNKPDVELIVRMD